MKLVFSSDKNPLGGEVKVEFFKPVWSNQAEDNFQSGLLTLIVYRKGTERKEKLEGQNYRLNTATLFVILSGIGSGNLSLYGGSELWFSKCCCKNALKDKIERPAYVSQKFSWFVLS